MCVCAASAASVGYKPWQPIQVGAKAVATAVVTAPGFVAKTIPESVKPVYEPAVYVDKDASIVRSESNVGVDGFNFV